MSNHNTTESTRSGAPSPEDSTQSVRAVGLRYVTDSRPGIRREQTEEGFRYLRPDGQEVTDEETLKRIKSLAIPPAYTDVWICARANGYLQATGRDAKERKQYRYHPRWRAVRDETKYHRMMEFGEALPQMRERVERDLARHGLPREKVLATVVRLLETTLIRVGNEEYARTNHHYGLTTLHNRHVDVEGATLHFHFTGKSGKKHAIDLHDRRLARIVRRIRALPGYELFHYIDENGETQEIGSEEVNEYLREITGQDFTAKDFRTWAGTVLAAMALQACETCETPTQAKKNIIHAIQVVAERLGNTPSVCRKCYVHPAIFDSYLEGILVETLQERDGQDWEDAHPALLPEESGVMRLLKKRLMPETEPDCKAA